MVFTYANQKSIQILKLFSNKPKKFPTLCHRKLSNYGTVTPILKISKARYPQFLCSIQKLKKVHPRSGKIRVESKKNWSKYLKTTEI